MENKIEIKVYPKLDFSDAIKALIGIQYPQMDLSNGFYIIPRSNLSVTAYASSVPCEFIK